ncbi:MAG: hypothetical protein CL677_07175 [Bdellovibrionaceae bacterium]|nr:hypothetical protein [Pseudobdellovibrionaceae bacterium]
MWVLVQRLTTGLVLLIATANLGCSTLSSLTDGTRRGRFVGREAPTAKLMQKAFIVAPNGRVDHFDSLDPDIQNTPVKIPTIRFRHASQLCNPNTASEKNALRQNELDLELAFMIQTLNSQQPIVTQQGELRRSLSQSMITNLYNTPDCAPFRFKLNIVKKLIEGHKLSRIEESIVR